MRILITTAIYPPDIGGPASYVPKIAQTLAARGHEVTVATMADGAGATTESFGRLVRIERRHTVVRRKLAASCRLLPLVRAADLIYANGLFEELKPIRRLIHRPMVAKIVGDWAWERLRNQNRYRADVDRFQTDRLRSPYARMVRYARSRALIGYDRMIVPSAYLSAMVAGWHPALPPVVVIHNGIDLPDGMAAAAPQPTHGRLRLVTVCRLVAWKHVDEIVSLVAARPGWTLDVVGDGPERQALEALARGGNGAARIRFHGAVARDHALQAMAAADVVVLNSDYEGLPHVLIEAMALSRPIVARRSGGSMETVVDGETGMIVDDAAGLAAALDRLAASPGQGIALGAAGRLRYDAMFTQQAMLDATVNQLESVARPHTAAAPQPE